MLFRSIRRVYRIVFPRHFVRSILLLLDVTAVPGRVPPLLPLLVVFGSISVVLARGRGRGRGRLRLLGHDALELRPQRLDRGELVADGDDGLERAVELVDVGQDVFEALFVVRGSG